jgi:hypothetical protein
MVAPEVSAFIRDDDFPANTDEDDETELERLAKQQSDALVSR